MTTETPNKNEVQALGCEASELSGLVMCDFSQGVCEDGAAILRDGVPMTVDEIVSELRQLTADANRYRYLRAADIDAVHKGGIFAGKTPENLVINGIDLDEEIDALLYT